MHLTTLSQFLVNQIKKGLKYAKKFFNAKKVNLKKE